MADASASAPSASAASSSPPPPTSATSAAPSDHNRSSSTPPELDSLSSTNVFAFGLHSSYGAFANDPSTTSSSLLGPSPPPSTSSQPLPTTPSGRGGLNAVGASVPATNLPVLSSMQQLNMGLMPLMPMPGMDGPHAPSSQTSADPFKGSAPHGWAPPSMDFSHLSLSNPSSLLHLNSPMAPQYPSPFLFSPTDAQGGSAPPSVASPALSGVSGGSDSSALHSDPGLSSLPMDFHPYYFLQGLPPMPLSSPSFDPFSMPMYNPSLQPHGGGGRGGMNPSICKFYAAGHCARGDQCNYAHVRADGTAVSAGHMRGAHLPRGRGRGGDFRPGDRGARGRGDMRGGGAPFRGHRPPHEQPQFPAHLLHPGQAMHKDGGGMHGQHGVVGAGNPLSPLSPSLVGMHPLADPSLLMHSPPFAPLDYHPAFNPWGQSGDGYFDLSSTLGVGLNASPDELVGRVCTLAKDQYGCRLLQRLLDDPHRLGVLDVVYEETLQHLVDLMTHPFANYLMQKLIEQCSDGQRLSVLAKVAPHLISISLNLHGTRAVQKLVETLTSPSETELLVESLKPSVIALIKDLNGNHVVQRCLHHLSSADNQFIYDAIARHCVSVSTHKHGCCVLQRALDYSTASQKRLLIAEICSNALELVQDAYGKYQPHTPLLRAAHSTHDHRLIAPLCSRCF